MRWDFRCEKCSAVHEMSFGSRYEMLSLVNDAGVYCPSCGGEMNRQPSSPMFKVIGGTPKFHNHGVK